MKVLGKEFQRLDDKEFELYLVDKITMDDEFFHILEKNDFGHFQKLNKIIYTDGEMLIISQRNVIDGNFIEVKYKLKSATWFLKFENNSIQLYVESGYEGQIKIKNRELDRFLKKHYIKCRNIITSKKQFAKDMAQIAQQLDLPFELVLSFRGDKSALHTFITTVKIAMDNCFYADGITMRKLINKSDVVRQEAFKHIGLYVPENYLVKSFQIGQYVYNCFEQREIVGYA